LTEIEKAEFSSSSSSSSSSRMRRVTSESD